jgi:hypothetical protein
LLFFEVGALGLRIVSAWCAIGLRNLRNQLARTEWL